MKAIPAPGGSTSPAPRTWTASTRVLARPTSLGLDPGHSACMNVRYARRGSRKLYTGHERTSTKRVALPSCAIFSSESELLFVHSLSTIVLSAILLFAPSYRSRGFRRLDRECARIPVLLVHQGLFWLQHTIYCRSYASFSVGAVTHGVKPRSPTIAYVLNDYFSLALPYNEKQGVQRSCWRFVRS